MKAKLLFVLFALAGLIFFGGYRIESERTARAAAYTVPVLSSPWTAGILSDAVGPAGILVEKLTPTGPTLTITCSNGHLYALRHQGGEAYDTPNFSEFLGCVKIASGDRNADGVRELYVVTDDNRLLVLAGDTFQRLNSLSLPVSQQVMDLAVGDADGDGAVEIALVNTDGLFVYQATTLSLEWQKPEYTGFEVRIANIDSDPQPELVVNGAPAHVLNAGLKTEEWAYSGGFGNHMDLGDVDQDGRAEIAFIATWDNAYVLEGDTQMMKWHLGSLGDLAAIKIADTDGNGSGEVIIGNGQWGSLTGYRGSDGGALWSVPNPEHGVFGIGVGDANDDGVKEIVWGAGISSSGKDALFIGSWQTESVLWASDDLDGPLYATAGDVDNDGQGELVMASFSTTSGYGGGTLRVYDGATHQVEGSTVVGNGYFNLYNLALGQLDGDPALEILVAGDNWYETRLASYDGLTHELEWQSPNMGSGRPYALAVQNLDSDSVDEIAIGVQLDTPRVQVLNGASSVIQWDSGALDGAIVDLALGKLDSTNKTNLAVLTEDSLYVYEADPWVAKLHEPVEDGQALAIIPADQNGPGELLLVADDPKSRPALFALSGSSSAIHWQRPLGEALVKELLVADLDDDLQPEFILLGSLGNWPSDPSLLWIGSREYPSTWEYRLANRRWGVLNSAGVANVDGDASQELVFGSSFLIQLNQITPSVKDLQLVHLPMISKPVPPRGLYGVVTETGEPRAGIPLQVRFNDGTGWSTVASGQTGEDGSYSFTGLPSLGPGQAYYVLYQNPGGESNRLWTWHTQGINSYQAGYNAHMGDFDVGNVSLFSPYDGATVVLPQLFRWLTRYYSPTDSYEFDLYDPYDSNVYFYTDPPLGFTSDYTLPSLPPGFKRDKLYGWEVWVWSPDGGFGVSYETWAVYFNASGQATLQRAPSLLARPGSELPEALLERRP